MEIELESMTELKQCMTDSLSEKCSPKPSSPADH